MEEIVRAESARLVDEFGFGPTAEANRRMTDEHCLNHYFRDDWVTYRETPQGVVVLAVGPDEIEQLLGSLDPEELPTVRTRQI